MAFSVTINNNISKLKFKLTYNPNFYDNLFSSMPNDKKIKLLKKLIEKNPSEIYRVFSVCNEAYQHTKKLSSCLIFLSTETENS